MKRILVILASAMWPVFVYANAKVVGNGGDRYAVEFVDLANHAYEILSKNQVTGFPLDKLQTAILSTTVESTERKLYLNGVLKDAINYPSTKLIVISRPAWDQLQDERTKTLLVIHEYLGILEIDDSRYSISGQLLKEVSRDSIVCVSIHLNREYRGAEVGKATLRLGVDNSAHWSDGLMDYWIYSAAKNLNFSLVYRDPSEDMDRTIKTQLDRQTPFFDFSFPVATSKTIAGLAVTQVEVECK